MLQGRAGQGREEVEVALARRGDEAAGDSLGQAEVEGLSEGARLVRDSDFYALLLKEAPFGAMDFDLKIGSAVETGESEVPTGRTWKSRTAPLVSRLAALRSEA